MIQAVMTKPGQIEFNDVPLLEPGFKQVRLKIMRIGVCGSDIHVYHGKHPYTSYPVVQGHEVSAIIDSIGPEVAGFEIGDLVTVQPQVVCGECYPCTHGLYNDCESLKVMGFQTTGMASEYFVVDADKVLKLPRHISLDQAAMVEPMAVAVHAVRRYGSITGKKVLVLGGGPIGNLVAQVSHALGAHSVLVSEMSAYRREAAQGCGLSVVNPAQEDLLSSILNQFGTDKADVIFECVGIQSTIEQAVTIARKGSDIVIVGVFGDPALVNLGFVQDHELRLIGTAMYRVEDYIQAIDLLAKGSIELNRLITHHFNFHEYLMAYQTIEKDRDKAMKVMIKIHE